MRRLLSGTILSFLVLSLIFTTSCSVVDRLVPDLKPVDRPAPPAVLKEGCPPAPLLPPRSAFPPNDVRPLVAALAAQIDPGDQCRIVVDGWKAWDACMRIRLFDPKAACPMLDQVLGRLAPGA